MLLSAGNIDSTRRPRHARVTAGPATAPVPPVPSSMSTYVASASRPQVKAIHGLERGFHAFDLGHEPPLDPAGGAADVDRRGVSLRWLGASVLTGVTGAALIGAAIFVSHDGEMTFAAVAERAVPGASRPMPGEERGLNLARKGDKLVRSEVMALAKQTFRAPMTVRNGDREAIRVRPVRAHRHQPVPDERRLRGRHSPVQPAALVRRSAGRALRRAARRGRRCRRLGGQARPLEPRHGDQRADALRCRRPRPDRGGAAARQRCRASRVDAGAAHAVAHPQPARRDERPAGCGPPARCALQLDRGARRPRERHQPRQDRAAQRRAVVRGARRSHPQG